MKPMNLNEALQFCDAAEALLAAHADDDTIRGFARTQAQQDFAHHAHPTLRLAIDKIRDLVGEVASLRTGIGGSEGALLRMWTETQAEVEELRINLIRARAETDTLLRQQQDKLEKSLNADYGRERLRSERLRELMSCGHPRACVVSADDDRDATGYCAWCEDLARWRGLLEIAADNAEGFREMLVECERETVGMKAELALMRGKASSRGGRRL